MTRRSSPEGGPGAEVPAPLEIRRYRDGDREAVIDLWRTCGLIVPHNDPVRDIAYCLASKQSALFVAEADARIVAVAMAGHDGHRGWLYYVAVSPELRGQGLGRRIVDHAEAWLASLGVRKVNLMIRDTNVEVEGFYESLGYAVEPRTVMSRWLESQSGSSESER